MRSNMCILVYSVHTCAYMSSPMPLHAPYGLRGLPSRLWPKCNRLLRLGRPWGAVALSDEVDGDIWSTRMGLNLRSTKLPRPWSPWKSSPSRKNPHCRTGNRTRDLVFSSQKLWPLVREAGLVHIVCYCCYFGLLLYFFEGHVIDTCGRDLKYVKICSS
jgi:hypothetical protein